MFLIKQNTLLLIVVLLMVAVPLLMKPNAEFSGADDKLKAVVEQAQPDYKPWSESAWKPQSSEVESLLFALQAGLGIAFIGYFFGYLKGRRAERKVQEETTDILVAEVKIY